MKGFFIIRYGDPLTGPNTNVANAGDQVQLTTRVYNFSPVDTGDPTLKTPAKKIWVSIFGQQYDPQRAALVGDSFLIGSQTLNKIPGFHPDSNTPNWVLVSLPNAFDTSDYAGKYLLFG